MKYDLNKINASESDRIELLAAHSEFTERVGAIHFLSNILFFVDNYPLERKPSLSADLSFDNCSGKIHKNFSNSEVIGNALYNIPYQPYRLTELAINIKTIRTTSGFQIVWPGKIVTDHGPWGTLDANANVETKASVYGFSNTTTGHGGFAGNIIDSDEDDIEVDESTIEDDFTDAVVIVTVDDNPFYFSSTLSKTIYIHGIFDSHVIWKQPTIFRIEELVTEEDDEEDEENLD